MLPLQVSTAFGVGYKPPPKEKMGKRQEDSECEQNCAKSATHVKAYRLKQKVRCPRGLLALGCCREAVLGRCTRSSC